MKSKFNLTGRVFGRLTVIRREGSIHGGRSWLCQCECGNRKIVRSYCLSKGETKSCGCLERESVSLRSTTHGYALQGNKSRTYKIWIGMRSRCNSPGNPGFKNYGGRGITCDSRWNSFVEFLKDMGEAPLGLSIERKDNELGYSRENCCWATRKQQARNTRKNHFIEFQGKRLCMGEWAEITGLTKGRIYSRLARGWPVGRTLTEPSRAR